MSNTNIMVIPNDILIEIVVRVPAKSLLRLRWACKYLFNLITRDHAFIKKNCLHHQTTSATNNIHDNDDRIISNTSFWISDFRTVVYTMNLGDFMNNDYHHRHGGISVNMDCYNLPFDNLNGFDDVEFFGSCNGLVLFVLHAKPNFNYDTYFLWNPCTREVKGLLDEPLNPSITCDCRVVGFGYDHIMDDYKVVRIIFYYKYRLKIDIGIYSLRSNSWSTKIVTDDDLLRFTHLQKQIRGLGVLVNGALHWTDGQGIGTITSFDITKEEFREIQGPNKEELIETERPINYVGEPNFKLILSVLNGCLCMCQMPHLKENYVIWMMKDYGVKDSWTKLFTIDMEKVFAVCPFDSYRFHREPFEQYYKDSGIIMVFNRNERDMIIVACDSKNDKARFIYRIQDHKYGFVNGRSVPFEKKIFVNGTYIESLVSLNSGMYLTLGVGSITPTFRKQDLLEYDVVCEAYSEKYLVRKWTKDD